MTTTYAWDLTGSLPNILQDSAGNAYVYGLDLISKTNGATQEYYLTDGLGSTTGITDGSGTVTGTYEYDAFGAVRAQTGATTEWSFTGEQHDATGLEYLRARYYDASTGRFLSQDPMPLLQRYAYANDNPANLVDPSGMSPESDRFHQLMAAEEQVQAWAKQILSDPCWKTQAFCKHVALVWKKFKEYGHECAAGAVGGAIVGGIAGLPGGVYGAAAGAGYGAMWGCLGGIAAHAADNTFGVSQNLAAQCLIGGVTATLTVVSASHGGVGGQPSRVGWGAAGGCVGGVFGWIARDVLAYAGADSGAQGVGQCGMFAGATLFGGLAVGGDQGDTISGAVGSCAGSILGGRVVP